MHAHMIYMCVFPLLCPPCCLSPAPLRLCPRLLSMYCGNLSCSFPPLLPLPSPPAVSEAKKPPTAAASTPAPAPKATAAATATVTASIPAPASASVAENSSTAPPPAAVGPFDPEAPAIQLRFTISDAGEITVATAPPPRLWCNCDAQTGSMIIRLILLLRPLPRSTKVRETGWTILPSLRRGGGRRREKA